MKKFGVIAFLWLVGVGIVGCNDGGYFYGEENVISIGLSIFDAETGEYKHITCGCLAYCIAWSSFGYSE